MSKKKERKIEAERVEEPSAVVGGWQKPPRIDSSHRTTAMSEKEREEERPSEMRGPDSEEAVKGLWVVAVIARWQKRQKQSHDRGIGAITPVHVWPFFKNRD